MSSAESIVVLSNVEHTCATFVWPDDLRYFVGYRFVEHEPKITAEPLPHNPLPPPNLPPVSGGTYPRQSRWLENWQTTYTDPENPFQLHFQTFADGSAQTGVIENNGRQERTWRFIPEENGVRIWLTLKTHEPLPGAYILQQCLRFTGGIGHGFNRSVATVPFLSELLMQALGNANGTLTWVRKNDEWLPLPVPFTRYHTAVAQGLYDDTAGQIDCGLIVRQSASRQQAPASYWLTAAPGAEWENWTAGLYWQRTACVSNRHPADCLHAGVDFGPLQAGQSRTLHGKFYWLEGTKDDLFDLWQQEFAE